MHCLAATQCALALPWVLSEATDSTKNTNDIEQMNLLNRNYQLPQTAEIIGGCARIWL